MFQPFSFNVVNKGSFELLQLKGYLEDSGGSSLKGHVQSRLEAGICQFAFDFAAVELISSPGVAALLDICGMVVDDFAGQVAAWGLDHHHSTVLEMSGFFFMAHQVADAAECEEYFNC